MTVSERIFDLLKKQGKKQGDLARALNVRPTTVSEWQKSPNISACRLTTLLRGDCHATHPYNK